MTHHMLVSRVLLRNRTQSMHVFECRLKDMAKSHIVRGACQAGNREGATVQTQSHVLVKPLLVKERSVCVLVRLLTGWMSRPTHIMETNSYYSKPPLLNSDFIQNPPTL